MPGPVQAAVRRTDDHRPAVLSIPAGHPYVTAVSAAMADAVVTLPDPTTPWWPHPALEPGWIAEHADSIDVAHLHFGFDHVRPVRLAAWCDELDGAGIPLVHTIHDLRNPHHVDRSRHDLHLELLVARAAHLFTLTNAAAETVARRHGRRPEVIAHPGVLWGERVDLAPVERGLVGIHLGPLRCNVVEAASVAAAAAVAAHRQGGHVVVDVETGAGAHRPDGPAELDALDRLAAAGDVTVEVRPPLSDAALATYLGRLHVAVLPYRFGSHSGWLEACRDAGTTVVAPSCGFYADQWADVISYRDDERSGLDAESLTEAVAEALSRPPPEPSDWFWRDRQRREVALAHVAAYCRVLDR